jgi:transposase
MEATGIKCLDHMFYRSKNTCGRMVEKLIDVKSLLGLPEELEIVGGDVTDKVITIIAASTQATPCCPLCGTSATRQHSSYSRHPMDVPCAQKCVRLILQVRKFFCDVRTCPRKIFTERLTPFIQPWARVTTRLFQEVEHIGLATSGMLGTRLGERLGIRTSWMTIIRRIMVRPAELTEQISEVGIDDFSFRRGRKFGTILVNMQSHQVVDLLPDRKAETAAAWLAAHPEIDLVSRDRGADYAAAARMGAPQAIQVADRFHIMKNLVEAVEVELARYWPEVQRARRGEQTPDEVIERPLPSVEDWRPPPEPSSKKAQETRRAERLDSYQQMQALHKKGMTAKQIAQQVGKSVRTIQRWLANGNIPEDKRRKKRSSFDKYAPYVLARWKEGQRNGQHLWEEIKGQGYKGSTRMLYRFLEALRSEQVEMTNRPDPSKKSLSARDAVWLFVRDPEDLDDNESSALEEVLQASTRANTLYQLAQEFRQMLHKREGKKLESWLIKAKESQIEELMSFVIGIERDKAAVVAGLTLPQNNGLVEGKVNKLKLIKRMMFGRAAFPLLRQRVIHAL